jgi:two-component system, chemotaxis family, sensor kinase CheA
MCEDLLRLTRMNEFLEQFLIEARELIEQGTTDLLALERAPADRETLDSAFRAFHTLKGGASIVDFAAMARAVHAAEEVLSAVRAGERLVTPGLISDCLSCLDRVNQWLDAIQDNGEIPENVGSAADLIVARFSPNSAIDRKAEAIEDESGSRRSTPSQDAILREQLFLITGHGAGAQGRMTSAGRIVANVLRHLGRIEDAEKSARLFSEGIERGDRETLARAIELAAEQIAEAPPSQVAAPTIKPQQLSRTLRIDSERVDALVNLAGELTVSMNAVGHIARLALERRDALAAEINAEHEKLDRLVSALQLAVLQLRVLPLAGLFQRFSRPVREMSASLAKPVRLLFEGEDTEADKAIIEMLFEPLLHVVRNALDHGIEPAAERESVGKPALATLYLRGRREGEHVLVEVEDDGRGIDAARIRSAAVERGIASMQDVAALSEDEAVDLIFVPGFSTATGISDVSGRGVGMDAVRTSVERLGGRVQVQTRPRAGSTVRFILPFSVMMTRVMSVETGGQKFGVPLDAVVETVRVPRDQIHAVGLARAFVWRNRTVPLIDLAQTLGLSPSFSKSVSTVVIVEFGGGELGGLEVDRLGERINVMLKPTEGLLSGLPALTGTTMLGDGSVLLILDVKEMIG